MCSGYTDSGKDMLCRVSRDIAPHGYSQTFSDAFTQEGFGTEHPPQGYGSHMYLHTAMRPGPRCTRKANHWRRSPKDWLGTLATSQKQQPITGTELNKQCGGCQMSCSRHKQGGLGAVTQIASGVWLSLVKYNRWKRLVCSKGFKISTLETSTVKPLRVNILATTFKNLWMDVYCISKQWLMWYKVLDRFFFLFFFC